MAKEINSDLLRGNINTIILKALYNGDRYGYDIVREIEIKSHGQYTIKQPTLYSCLKRLESQGFVSSYWGTQSNGGRRKYFSLTDMGREVFKQSQDDYEYSRTIIDKLISEDRYDLGEYTPAPIDDEENAEIASTESVQQETTVVDTIEEVQEETVSTDGAVLDQDNAENEIAEQNIDEQTAEIDADEIETKQEENTDDVEIIAQEIIQNGENSDGFLQYIAVSNDNSADYVIDDASKEENQSVITDTIDEVASTCDNTSDIASMFDKESANGSYIDNIESVEPENSSSGFATMFSSDLSSSNEDADLFGNGAGFNAFDASTFEETNAGIDEHADSEYNSFSGQPETSENLKNQLESLYDTVNQSAEDEKKDEFISYDRKNDPAFASTSENYEQTDEYQNKLGDIIENFYTQSSIELTKEQIEISALELNNKVQIRPFGSAIVDSARELGEEVHVRSHNNVAKSQYTTRYYYQSNLLRLFINAILLVVMLAESFISWLIFKKAVGANGQYDVAIYVLSILLALALPVYAGVRFGFNPYAKKRIENDYNTSLIFKAIVMILICVLCFLLHLYMGMPLSGDISKYAVSLFMPMILSTNLPLSAVIFKLLYKSPYFMIKE